MKDNFHLPARPTLDAFYERFGRRPARLFRAPGRINLRGMHVDTHGGFLNLMTHQREVTLAVAPTGTSKSILANAHPDFAEVTFDLAEEWSDMAGRGWWDAIASPEVAGRARARRSAPETAWSNYCIGAALRVAHIKNGLPAGGLL
ncbi:MAG TPA: galactokinase family protein, partial [Candidatus Hydrogenedentes bacterium]|nr:galactokinase family protein [Candidatus Hydrogenedentota bacterium]